MTQERKAELEQIRDRKKANGIAAADSILDDIQTLKRKLDLSEYFYCIEALTLALEPLSAERDAEEFEISTYGVELGNIRGEWDAPISIVDMRTTHR